MLDSTTIFLYIIGAALLVTFLRYISAAQYILGLALKKPQIEIIDRSDCPEYLRRFYETEEKQLIHLGFRYAYCLRIDELYVKKHPKKYIFVYYHQAEKTCASLAASNTADPFMPVYVDFTTLFTNGKRLLTYNGVSHLILGTLPNTILTDAYAETVEKQFQFHLRQLKATHEGDIKEYNEKMEPETIIAEETGFYEDYLEQLETDGLIYRSNDGTNTCLIKTLASIGFAHRMISGARPAALLRHKIIQKAGEKEEIEKDFPVELEITNYLNHRAALNQPMRNKSGKIFFLVLSLLLFAGVFSFIISFQLTLILIGVVFLHESGHLLAMHLLGYRNLSMLFLPLFGAVTMGSHKGAAPYKKVIALFAGPMPGLLLAFLLLLLQQSLNSPALYSGTVMGTLLILIIVNYFNLLPIMPLDGGQILDTIIFSRVPVLQLIFQFISLTALLLLAVLLKEPILLFVSLFVLFGFKQYFTRRRIMKTLKEQVGNDPRNLSEEDLLKRIFLFLRKRPFQRFPFRKKVQLVGNMESHLQASAQKASKRTVVFTLAVYLMVLAAPFIYWFSKPFTLPDRAFRHPCEVVQNTAKPVDISVERSHFERLDMSRGKESFFVCHRFCLAPHVSEGHAGDFLSRIWALYGKPDDVKNGFSYTFLHRKSGIIFTAYLEILPAYGSPAQDVQKTVPVLYRFEELLQQTTPVDCFYIYESPYGTFEVGAANGNPYMKEIKKRTRRDSNSQPTD